MSTTVSPARLVWSREFKIYLAARIISLIGSSLTFVALPVLVYVITHSAYWTALVSLSSAVPYLLVGAIAGVAADRRNQLRVMISAELISGISLGSVPIVSAIGSLTALQIMIAALISRCAFVFFDAANFGELVRLVAEHNLPKANSVVYGSSGVIEVAGPVVAGILLTWQGPTSLVTFDVATYLISASLLFHIGASGPGSRLAGSSFGSLLKEGFSYLWMNTAVRSMTLLNMALCFSAGGYYAEVIVWADHSLHVSRGDAELGVLYAAFEIGATIGSFSFARLRSRFDSTTKRSATLFISGVSACAAFLAPNWLLASCGVAIWAFWYMLLMLESITVRQLSTPHELQGRVNIIGRSISLGIGWPLGAACGGIVASHSAAQTALVACVIPLLLAGLIALFVGLSGRHSMAAPSVP